MKLYCWRAKGCDLEAFVMAEDEADARRALEAVRPAKPVGEPSDSHEWFLYKYRNQDIDSMLSNPKSHELIVLEHGQVAWAEVS